MDRRGLQQLALIARGVQFGKSRVDDRLGREQGLPPLSFWRTNLVCQDHGVVLLYLTNSTIDWTVMRFQPLLCCLC